MTRGLLLGDLVAAAQLDRATARYVLGRAAALGVGEASGQGQHRRFDPAEAVRLATCTRLVMHGVPLDRAVAVTNWAEGHWRSLARANARSPVPYASPVATPWRLRLVNGRYAQLWHDRPRTMRENDLTRDEDQLFDVAAEIWVARHDLEEHLPELSWNATMLAARLVPPPGSGAAGQDRKRGPKR